MGTPVELGVVQSLARPGGNITGLVPAFGRELQIKQLELIREMLPKAKRVAIFDVKEERTQLGEEAMRQTATGMGLTLVFVDAQLPRIEAGFAQLERERVDALSISGSAPPFMHRNRIVDFARKTQLPDFHTYHQAVDAGALASHGHDPYDIFRRAAGYVDRILKSAKPAEMPVEQIERYTLVLNLKTAKALGLTIPLAVRIRAERVIE